MNSGLSTITWTACGFLLSWMVPAVADAQAWIAGAIVVIVAAAIAAAVYLWRD